MQNSIVDDINKRLAEKYGKNLLEQPYFKISWSNDLYEIRVGTFNEFYGSIFLRTYRGARKVRKYNYIQNRWILERWQEKNLKPTDELPNPDGYEILYLFEDKNRNPLPPIWRVANLICDTIFNSLLTKPQLKQAIEEEQEKIYADDVKYFEDMFDSSALQSRFHFGEAVILGGKNAGNKVNDS
jgi:hypothetical protein